MVHLLMVILCKGNGCQDVKNNYLGYDVIIAASANAIDITEDASTSFVLNQTPEEFWQLK